MQYVKISDVSLSQIFNSNITLSFKEKLEIAKKLEELCVDTIEIGPITDSKADEVLIKTLSNCITKTTLALVCGCDEKCVEKAYSLISQAKKKKLIIKVPVSTVKMEYCFGSKPSAVLSKLKDLTIKAISLCSDVEVCLDDATRSESEFLNSAISTAIECGARSICISDQAGLMEPNEFNGFITQIRNNVKNINNIELFVECTDSFSMATASMLGCFGNGVSGVKLSAMNVGNLAKFEAFLKALEYMGEKKGFSSKINKTCVSRVVSLISSFSSSTNNVTKINDNEENQVTISKISTLNELTKLVKSLGYDLSGDDVKKVLEEVKRFEGKKDLTKKDLDSIIAVTSLQVPSTFKLINYAVHCSNVISSTANITLSANNKTMNGIAIGNGSIDSAFLAIENALGRHFDLEEFVVNGVTEGKEAMGETIIKLRNNGKLYSGRGVSTDIVGASIRAFINAVNKIVYEERE